MVWRKGKERREGKGEASASPHAEEAAVDFAGDLLRGLGEHVVALGDVDPETVHEAFEAWARHLLVGAPVPGQPDHAEPIPVAQRSWSGGAGTAAKSFVSSPASMRSKAPCCAAGRIRYSHERRFAPRGAVKAVPEICSA